MYIVVQSHNHHKNKKTHFCIDQHYCPRKRASFNMRGIFHFWIKSNSHPRKRFCSRYAISVRKVHKQKVLLRADNPEQFIPSPQKKLWRFFFYTVVGRVKQSTSGNTTLTWTNQISCQKGARCDDDRLLIKTDDVKMPQNGPKHDWLSSGRLQGKNRV